MMHKLQPTDPQLIGPYRLRGRLGAGGMGQVFLGLSAGGRPVAVKVVRPHLATDPSSGSVSGPPRTFRTALFALFHAASCRFRYSSWASCGVL